MTDKEPARTSSTTGKAQETAPGQLHENDIARTVVHAAYRVHSHLGPGLLESVYETILAHEIEKAGLHVARQTLVPVTYDGIRFDEGFRIDLLVADKVISWN